MNKHCGTGVVTVVSSNKDLNNISVACHDKPSRIVRLCSGYDHLVLLKENNFVQRISDVEIFDNAFSKLPSLQNNILDIQFGKHHCLCLTENGIIFSFGFNNFGQLGIGTYNDENTNINIPTIIEYFRRITRHQTQPISIIQIACGLNHSCCITSNNDIYTWGNGQYGQLALSNPVAIQVLPKYVSCFNKLTNNKISYCTSGDFFTAILTENGQLFMCGEAMNYQCGNGRKTQENKPIEIILNSNDNENKDDDNDNTKENSSTNHKSLIIPYKIACGFGHTLCLTKNGDLYGWGLSLYGQLGLIQNNQDNNKRVDKPMLINYFKQNNIRIKDIDANGNGSIIVDTNNNIYFMGKNDILFPNQIIFEPKKLQFDNSMIIDYGFCHSKIASVSETRIDSLSPQIFTNSGDTILKICGKNTFYETLFEPKIKFNIQTSLTSKNIETTIIGKWDKNNNKSDYSILTVQSPNIETLAKEQGINKPIDYPCKIFLSVALDGKLYCQPITTYIINKPNSSFMMKPTCGDIQGNVNIILTMRDSQYFKNLKQRNIKLNDMKIIFENCENNDINYHTNAQFKDKSQMTDITFITPPNMQCGKYQVLFAIDGHSTVNTRETFISYDIKPMNEIQPQISLNKFENTIPIEIEVDQFAYTNRDKIKIKITGSDESHVLTLPCQYESESAYHIRKKEYMISQEYEAKRDAIEQQRKTELEQFTDERKKQDEEKDAWIVDFEKKKKKVAKKADKLKELEDENETKMKEYEEIIKQREIQDNKISSTFKKQTEDLIIEEKNLPKEPENDNGLGFVRFSIEKELISGWEYPLVAQIDLTCNLQIFSSLTKIPFIAPRIDKLVPETISITSDSIIETIISGIEIKDFKEKPISVYVTEDDKHIEIPEPQLDVKESIIKFTVPTSKIAGLKSLHINVGEDINLQKEFYHHPELKVTKAEPKSLSLNGGDNLIVHLKDEIPKEFSSQICFILIEVSKELKLEMQGKIDQDRKKLLIDNIPSLESLGATKKATIHVSLNKVQWFSGKATVAIK